MSYQPFPNDPGGAQPVVQQPGAPFAPVAQPGKRRRGLIVAGLIALLAGLGGGGALIVVSGSGYLEAVENLARAPIGCTTSLDFESTGTFTVYVETAGEIGEVRGDCNGTDSDYDFGGRGLPDVELTLLDPDDNDLDLDDDESKSYDVGDFEGTSIFTVEIEDTGRHSITVESDDEDFAIAVGKDPESAAATTGLAGIAVLAVGVIAGIVMLLLGLRRRKPNAGSGGGAPSYAEPVFAAQPAPGYQLPPQQQFPGAQGYPPGQPPAPPAGGFGQPQWPSPPNS